MKKLCLLGATGSIGKSCVDIVNRFPEKFSIRYVSAHRNIEDLFALAQQFRPEIAVLSGTTVEAAWQTKFKRIGVKIESGVEALAELAGQSDYDLLVNAVVGAAGLQPTLSAIGQNKNVAIANKETLVTAGDLVTRLSRQKNVQLFPIDSEHSALWQCLVGEDPCSIERLILTASGGPFRELPASEFKNVTVEQALRHPNWAMGQKITIDSATLMNKGLEVIEAFWLFDVDLEDISVLIHPQSIIHSIVQFIDGSQKAQMGLPDMKLPIQYALAYPKRISNNFKRLSFKDYPKLTFEEPDYKTFRNLALAKDAMYKGGNTPCVMNAANEIAVQAFLQNKVSFIEISDVIEKTMGHIAYVEQPDLEEYEHSDKEARLFATELVKKSQLAS